MTSRSLIASNKPCVIELSIFKNKLIEIVFTNLIFFVKVTFI